MAQGGVGTVDLRWVDGAGHGGDLFDAETGPAVAFLAARLDVTPIPVPASLPLLLAGFGGLGLFARRKAKA